MLKANKTSFEQFVAGYLHCALWSSHDEHGEPLDAVFGTDDFAPEALEQMRSDCRDFLTMNSDDLNLYAEQYTSARGFTSWECAGHDFWLTRNGHGAGFWDRGLGELGERLTDAAKVYSSCDLIVGDDGLIHT